MSFTLRIIKILVLLFCLENVYSQKIIGLIVDENKNPLPGVNVYYDGTTIYTLTDEKGTFILDSPFKNNNLLVISSIGYKTQYLKDYQESLYIQLEPEINELKEVVVKNSGLPRKLLLKLFKDNFIGTTKNGKAATILNEDILVFDYNMDKKELTAYANDELIILSPRMGYKIFYKLVDFKLNFSHKVTQENVIKSFYAGVSRFEETTNSKKVIENREQAYLGSQLHLFRAIANKNTASEGFLFFLNRAIIENDNHIDVTQEEDYYKVTLLKFPKFDKSISKSLSYSILYNKNEQSSIIFYTNTFKIYKFGTFDELQNIYFSGKISEKKIGDLVPLNYKL